MQVLEVGHPCISFREFCIDVSARRLLKAGQPVRIQDQPFQMLLILVEKSGEVVTREEFRRRLWPEGTFVDFDNSLNAAMNKLREALSDSADEPRFIETLPRRGYRFICPVQMAEGPADGAAPREPSPVAAFETLPSASEQSAPVAAAPASSRTKSRRRFWIGVAAGVLAVAVLGAAMMGWLVRSPAEAGFTRFTLAVLPFKNLSGDPAQDVFTGGLTEEMITQLGRLQPGRLSVVSSSAVERYRNSSLAVGDIGRELSVAYVLEGGVRREGNRLRITAQLVHVDDQLQVFAQTYESDAGALLEIQKDVGARIARALEHELLASTAAAGPSGSPAAVRPAVDAYLHGRFLWSQRTSDGVRKALEYFQKALAAEPNFAPAHAGIADCYMIWSGRLLGLRPAEAYPRAREAAQKALQLDPSLAEAHATLAVIRFEHDWDFAGADREYRRAIELKPDYAFAHQWYAEYLATMGRHQEAVAEVRRALELDPFSRSINLVYGQILMYSRDYVAATAQFRKLIDLHPDFAEPYAHLNRIYLQQGKEREFAEYFLQWAERTGFLAKELEGYRRAYQSGDVRALLRERKRVLLQQAETYYRAPYMVARIHALLGERDAAFQWLEKAMLQRDDFIIHVTVDPEFDSIRSDPRFQQLLKRIGLP
ncbi:MAG: TPR end-of-group domain-containing protein [Candidatus Acidiferrales bacterium]